MEIFVSHHNTEAFLLKDAKEFLQQYGINLFLAHDDIEPGTHDLNAILGAIDKCHVFVFLSTKRSLESCFCNQEIGYALAKKKPIYPFCHDSQLPQGFIARNQAVPIKDIKEEFGAEVLQIAGKNAAEDSDFYKWIKPRIDALKKMKVKGLLVGKQEQDYLSLEPDDWNDFGYKTSFHIFNYRGNLLGHIKIAYLHQQTGEHTDQHLLKKFRFLPKKYVSSGISEIDAPDIRDNLCIVLNQYTECPEAVREFKEADIYKSSILRNEKD